MRRDPPSPDATGPEPHDDPAADQALDWFLTLRDGTADAATRAEFARWQARDPRHAAEFRRVTAAWGAESFAAAVQELPAAATAAAPRRRPMLRRMAGLAIAAGFAALALWQGPALMIRLEADHRTATGARATITLPDGSTMMLDTASAVTVDFDGGRRLVTLLKGEAWFDVRHDPDHPFRVTGGFTTVTVLGTAFAVEARDDRDEIVLERGRVEVARRDGLGRPVVMVPGQQVIASAAGLDPARPVDTSRALAWREGRLVFHDRPLGEVVDSLARYHPGYVILADREAAGLAVSGSYRLDDVGAGFAGLADAAGLSLRTLPGGILVLE